MPQNPDIISGTIYTSRGTVANSIVIINSDIQTITDSNGRYTLDLANLSSGYISGNSYSIESYDEFNNEYKSDTIVSTGTGQTKHLYLDPRTRTNEQARPTGYVTPVSMRMTGNTPISNDNPLIVLMSEKKFTQKFSAVSGTSKTEYIGLASPGTPTNQARWQISKLNYSGNFVTGILWASGNSDFDKKWDGRAGYQYS